MDSELASNAASPSSFAPPTSSQGKSEWLALLLGFFCTALALFVWIYSFPESSVTPDSGYTLPMAESIAEGKLLFRDLGVQHTTFVMFIFAGLGGMLRYLCNQARPTYEDYLALTYAVTAIVLVLTAALIRLVSPRKDYLFFGTAMAALGLYVSEGWCINLEPFVLLFGLTAQLLFLHSKGRSPLIVAGLLAGLAFIAKQYGVFIIASIGLTILTDKRRISEKLLDCVFVSLAFLVAPLAYVSFLSLNAPGGLDEVLLSLSGRWYAKEPGSFLVFVRLAVSATPFIIFVPFCLSLSTLRDNEAFRLCLFAFCLSILQGLVRQYGHYYIHCLPYAVAMSAMITSSKVRPAFAKAVMILGVVGLTVATYFQLEGSGSRNNVRSLQRGLTKGILRHVPEQTRVFLIGPPFFMYLCHFLPPNDLVPGYNFLQNYTPDEIRGMLRSSEVVLLWKGNEDQVRSLLGVTQQSGFDLMKEIDTLGFQQFSQIIHAPTGLVLVTMFSREQRFLDQRKAQGNL